jgi:hypothetical protein
VGTERSSAGLWVTLVLSLSACSTDESFDCQRIAPDLANRCGTRFSVADPSLCAFIYPAGQVIERLDQLTINLCTVAAPIGNEECYLSESCEDIAANKCLENVSQIRRIDPDCKDQCVIIDKMCFRGCPSTGTPDACDACMLECEQARIDCEAMCPLAP